MGDDNLDRDTNYPGEWKDLLASILGEMNKNTALLESILAELKQINRNKQDQNPPVGKGKEIVTFHKELPECHRHFHGCCSGQSLPQSVSLRTEGKKYRLHIEGEVYNHEVPDKKGSITRNVIRGKTFKVEVILKDGDQQVDPDDPFASVRVELVVLDGEYYIERSTHWRPEEFEGRFMMVSSKDKNKMVSKDSISRSSTRVAVDEGVFSLVGGRQVHDSASINKISERNEEVKLGVMVYPADRGQERVLEGVSSNKFNVIDKLRPRPKTGTPQLNANEESILGKRGNSDNAHPSTSNSQYSGQSTQQFGQHALHPGSGGTAPPQAFGLPASSTMHLDISPMRPTTNYTAGARHGPPPHNLMMGCVPNGINDDIQKIVSDLSAARVKFEKGIWVAPNYTSLIPNLGVLQTRLEEFSGMLQQGSPTLVHTKLVAGTIYRVLVHDMPSVLQPEVGALKSHLVILHGKLCELETINIGASSVPHVAHQGTYGAPGGPSYDAQGSVVPATDLNMTDLLQNADPSGQSLTYPAPGTSGHDGAGHPSSTPGMGGHGGFGWQQHGTMLWRPSYAWTPNSRWTSGLSPTYLGQTNGSNRNFLDQQQYSEDYSVVPSEYDNAYAAGEQIENTYGPYGYGNEGILLVRNSRPALMRRPPQEKLADSPLLYTPISSSIPFGYLINDHYHGARSMVGMSHQQAMNNEGVMRKIMYRRVLMMTIYEGWRLYGNNPIWWTNLVDSHAAVKRISQQQAMDEIVEMMRRLDITKSCLTTGMRRKKEVQVVVEPEPSSSSSVLVNTKQQEVKSQAASLGDDKNNNNKSFVVVDLKATCWNSDENKDRRLRQEIVEFSSVLVDAATGHTKSTFHKYVIPTENHVLSEYCKNYNGIEQEAVERRNGAVMLSEALHLHQEWIGRLTNWNSAAAVVVAWGNWDCRTMLKQECFRKKLPIPDYFAQWINLKTPFADKYGNGYWSKPVKEALEATEVLEWEGAIKGGRSHARNKARLLSLLIHQGANLAITSWLDPAAAAPNN